VQPSSAPGFTRAVVEQRLSEANIPFSRVALAGGATLIVSSYGARVYGPFFTEQAASINWMPAAFANAQQFQQLIASGFWNVGGERVWVGPEIRYMITDRADYWGSYTMPPQLDPGQHELAAAHSGAQLTSSFTLESHLEPRGSVAFEMELVVASTENPLRTLPNFEHDFAAILFAGYTSDVTLGQRSAAAIVSESWILNQVAGGGTALIPAVSEAEITDYYEAVGDSLERVDGGFAVALTGSQRFKIGVKSAHNFGRLGHYVERGDDSLLIVRDFLNDPGQHYSEEPDFSPGVRGDSLHLYNDDGGLGGFAELEARGRTVGLVAGHTTSTDRFTTWCYSGSETELARVAKSLLGIDVHNLRKPE
jgi:hypothetical protein